MNLKSFLCGCAFGLALTMVTILVTSCSAAVGVAQEAPYGSTTPKRSGPYWYLEGLNEDIQKECHALVLQAVREAGVGDDSIEFVKRAYYQCLLDNGQVI